MAEDPFRYALLAALAIALLGAAWTDLSTRRIANPLNAAIALGAPLFWWASGLSLWPDIAQQLAVALASLTILTGLFALRAMGGGDVKLLTALALWIEPALFLKLVILMTLLGGVLTIALGAWHLARQPHAAQPGKLTVPYGVAIALAALCVIGLDYLPPAGTWSVGEVTPS